MGTLERLVALLQVIDLDLQLWIRNVVVSVVAGHATEGRKRENECAVEHREVPLVSETHSSVENAPSNPVQVCNFSISKKNIFNFDVMLSSNSRHTILRRRQHRWRPEQHRV